MKKETIKSIINIICTVLSAIAATFCSVSCYHKVPIDF